MKTIGIIGYGRFGRFLGQALQEKYKPEQILFYDPQEESSHSLELVCKSELIILTVPIHAFEEALISIKQYLQPESVLMDVCSVKSYPKECFGKHLGKETNYICSHPMFGPATYKKRQGDLSGLKVVLEQTQCPDNLYNEIQSLYSSLGVEIIEMSADEHDRLTARFQFTALSTGLILKEIDLGRSKIDTGSASVMMDFVDMISIDKELLRDMYRYNPYCKDKWEEFERAFFKLQNIFDT